MRRSQAGPVRTHKLASCPTERESACNSTNSCVLHSNFISLLRESFLLFIPRPYKEQNAAGRESDPSAGPDRLSRVTARLLVGKMAEKADVCWRRLEKFPEQSKGREGSCPDGSKGFWRYINSKSKVPTHCTSFEVDGKTERKS